MSSAKGGEDGGGSRRGRGGGIEGKATDHSASGNEPISLYLVGRQLTKPVEHDNVRQLGRQRHAHRRTPRDGSDAEHKNGWLSSQPTPHGGQFGINGADQVRDRDLA